MKADFEWDPEKEGKNIRKHEVNFDEASSVFDDPMFITVLDEEHSSQEERYITIGLSNKNRLLLVAPTERNDLIRIISARRTLRSQAQGRKQYCCFGSGDCKGFPKR